MDVPRTEMNTQIVLTNSGSIYNSLDSGQVTWSALYSIQALGNQLVRLILGTNCLRHGNIH